MKSKENCGKLDVISAMITALRHQLDTINVKSDKANDEVKKCSLALITASRAADEARCWELTQTQENDHETR